jgi:RNA polymerase sigma factor (sigma-70 family)
MAGWRRAPESPEAYVRRAIVTANLSRFRRRRVVETLVDVVPDASAHQDESTPGESRGAMVELLAGLTPRQRTVMVLRYQEDWPETEIAAAMGVSPGTVKTLASRAMTALRATVPASTTERTGS